MSNQIPIKTLVEQYLANKDYALYREIFNRVKDYVKRINDVYKDYNGYPYYFEPTSITTFELRFEGQVVRGYLPDDDECLFAFEYEIVDNTTADIAAQLISTEEERITDLTAMLSLRKIVLDVFKEKYK